MLIDYRPIYPADRVELAIPGGWQPDAHPEPRAIDLVRRTAAACRRIGIQREAVIAAAGIAVVRMAIRHGSLGDDRHAYHNEDHLLDLLADKLPALLAVAPLPLEQREALALFCAFHDLRQRETLRHDDGSIGANEAASLAEAERLLDALGLSGSVPRMALRFAIIGSTFATGADEHDLPRGAFAHRLAAWLDATHAGWRADATTVEAEHLARMAADIDTSNVASIYGDFAESAAALATELQFRAGRDLGSEAAGLSCLAFLTDGQERYITVLQRFASFEGRTAFGAQRDANAPRVREVSRRLRERFPEAVRPTGHDVIAAFRAIAAEAH